MPGDDHGPDVGQGGGDHLGILRDLGTERSEVGREEEIP